MNNILVIKYPTSGLEWGSLTLDLNHFLPCNQKKWKQVWELLEWRDFDGRLRRQLYTYVKQRMEEVKDDNSTACCTRVDVGDSIASLQEQISSSRQPNGLPIPKDALKDKKARLKEQKKELRGLNQKIKKTHSDYQKLSKHLEYMEKEGFV